MDKELLFNKSGIKDVTAYKAILRSGGGTTNMGNLKDTYEINSGEVWEVENNGNTRTVVILACFERYAATIALQDTEPCSNEVQVRAGDIMYADAGRLGYMYYDKMVDFVRKLTAAEMEGLQEAIRDALNLETLQAETLGEAQGEIKTLREDLEAAQEKIESQAEELEEAANRVKALEEEKNSKQVPGAVELVAEDYSSLREDLAAAVREAEVYKRLYEDMLARALA